MKSLQFELHPSNLMQSISHDELNSQINSHKKSNIYSDINNQQKRLISINSRSSKSSLKKIQQKEESSGQKLKVSETDQINLKYLIKLYNLEAERINKKMSSKLNSDKEKRNSQINKRIQNS